MIEKNSVNFLLVSLDRGWILVQRSVCQKNQSRRVYGKK